MPDLSKIETPNMAPYIFISYHRDSVAEARQIQECLNRSGFRIWLDVENIRHTERWPISIDRALRETDRIILLLTPESMSSDEVFNEWFFFYSEHKPIHCLMVKTCKPHYQLVPFQWLDWRKTNERDWKGLIDELQAPFEWPSLASRWKVINSPFAPSRSLPSTLQALLDAVRRETGAVALSDEQIEHVVKYSPGDLTEYRLVRIAEWSQAHYQLDNRFAQLPLIVDQNDSIQRWSRHERFNDLREVLAAVPDEALVLLGAPGSGKSTLLRRLELDIAVDGLRANSETLTFFIQLAELADSTALVNMSSSNLEELLAQYWHARFPKMPPLSNLLQKGGMLLLLDALDELPNYGAQQYRNLVELWRQFLSATLQKYPGNRFLFSCRILDYSYPLSSSEHLVRQIRIELMNNVQIQQFLTTHLPDLVEVLSQELVNSPQSEIFRTPFFLKLFIASIERKIPELSRQVIENMLKK